MYPINCYRERRDGGEHEETSIGDSVVLRMEVDGIDVTGDATNVVVRLGGLTVRPRESQHIGPVRLELGEPLAIDFDGDGRVALRGHIIPRT